MDIYNFSFYQKENELIEKPEIVLYDVSIEKAISNNHQLSHPSFMPSDRKLFFELIEKYIRFI